MAAMGGKRTLSEAATQSNPLQMRWLWFAILSAASFALGACQHEQRASTRVAVIALSFEPPNTCRMTVNGQTFTLFTDEAGSLAALRQQAAVVSAATVTGDFRTPYKCFGGAVYLAQRAGFERVGFVAEPPLATSKP